MLEKRKIHYIETLLKIEQYSTDSKYKRYKNKLTNIMRTCKKDYYYRLLDINKSNIKGIWNVLNSIIRN